MSPDALKPGALFIADAHYHSERRELFFYLQTLLDSPPPQLFLMGDIFDLLIGTFPGLLDENRELIELIEQLGKRCEVYFFEGNHDFLLEGVFRHVTYVPLAKQPMLFAFGGQRVAVSHGDFDENPAHNLFTRLLRNRFFITALHWATFDFLGNWFVKKVQRNLKAKKLCRTFDDFEAFIIKKIKKNFQNADVVIEGHYHQGCLIKHDGKLYCNVDGFACNQSSIVVESAHDKISFRNNKR
jgi:UDP-2,3-diacylglucosamine hydrolase